MGIEVASKKTAYPHNELSGGSWVETFSRGGITFIGTLLNGRPVSAGYISPPRYRAFRFLAQPHDRYDIWVRSEDGDAVAWVLDANYQTLAWNDDADSGTTDAHISLTVPQASPVFYLVFREYQLRFAHFVIQLNWSGRGPDHSSVLAGGVLAI